MKNGETNYETVFGKIAVEQGLCTDNELQACISQLEERRKNNPVLLQDLMVELGVVTRSQAQRLKDGIVEAKAAVQQIPGYKILGKLGAGAMAIVYKARQLSLDRTVAIKILPKRFSENPEYVERFYKEGQAAARLNHNNIVQAIDVGEAGGYHYFVMEYVEGKTVYDDLASGKVFSEAESLDIVIQVAQALAHAHARGLIHRDVKPKNVMINIAGVAKLADMGLARATADLEAARSEAGKAYGTPYYISPEQIRGEIDIDGRSDIYGLGATLYHMLTGRVPYMAEDPADVMRKHLKEPLIPPDHVNTSLSTGISEVVEVMMAKRREDRYATAEELLVDLEAVRAGQVPPRAHGSYEVSELEKLEQGEEVEVSGQEENPLRDQVIARYRITVLVLTAVAAACLLIIIVLLLGH